jgi:electron transfer flavoprotein beta subunit
MTVDPLSDRRPLVVACLRVVDLRPEVDLLTGAVTSTRFGLGLSAADAAALESAFQVAEARGGHVLAVAVGPSSIEAVLREVVALGATVVRVADGESDADGTGPLTVDEHALARTIVAAIAPYGRPSVVLCGDRSADRGTGALPAFLAHELHAAQALGLVSLGVEATATPDGELALVAERRLDGGWRERLRVTVPAVCSIEGAGIRLRRASLEGALRAEATSVTVAHAMPAAERPFRVGPVRVFEPRARVLPAPDSHDPRTRLLALTGALVAHDPPTIVGPVGAVEAVDAFLAFMARHGYLDGASAGSTDTTTTEEVV